MDYRFMNDLVINEIRSRMMYRIPSALFNAIGIDHPVRIAGNSCNVDTPHDIDVYPGSDSDEFGEDFRLRMNNISEVDVLSTTKNAITVRMKTFPYPVQFCSYRQPTLDQLINTFDFSHVQVGVEVRHRETGILHYISDVKFTDNYMKYLLTRRSEYIHSEYPLSSLIRTFKYKERGYLDQHACKAAVLSILTDILKRGYADYDDFKDQMDAIDLGLLDGDECGELGCLARKLFNQFVEYSGHAEKVE